MHNCSTRGSWLTPLNLTCLRQVRGWANRYLKLAREKQDPSSQLEFPHEDPTVRTEYGRGPHCILQQDKGIGGGCRVKFLIVAGYLLTLLLSTVEAETALFGRSRIGFHGGTFRPGAGSFRDLESSAPLFGAAVGVLKQLFSLERTYRKSEMGLPPLFRVATHAVAVANASPDLKLHATQVIGPNQEDSVVRYIRDHWRTTAIAPSVP